MRTTGYHSPLTLPGLCLWAWSYAMRRPMALAAVVTTLLLKVGLDVMKPWPVIFLIEYVLRKTPMPPLVLRIVNMLPGEHTPTALAGWSIAANIILFVLSWLMGVIATYGNIHLGQRMTYDLAGDLFVKLQQLSLNFHARKSVGDNLRRVTTDCACVSVIVKDALLPVCSSVISLLVMFGILWPLNHRLTLLALLVAPYMIWVFAHYTTAMMERSYEQQAAEARTYDFAEQTFSAIPVVQAFSREQMNDMRFATINRSVLNATLSLTSVELRFKVLMASATALGTAMVLW